MNKIKYNPLAVVSSVPLWPDDTDEKLSGWLLTVDFPGLEVPVVPGAVLYKSSLVASEKYSNKYSSVTQAKYLFKKSGIGDAYRKMCQVQTMLNDRIRDIYVQNMKSGQIMPVCAKHHGFLTYGVDFDTWVVWQLSVDFKGDITEIYKKRLAKQCGLLPRGSEVREFTYNPESNTTSVMYQFKENEHGHPVAMDRAADFDKRLELKRFHKEEAHKSAVVPIRVSEMPEYNKDGYRICVQYDGDFDNYFPNIANHFEYNPFGAKIKRADYNPTENMTEVEYIFKPGVWGSGASRAWHFIEKIKSEINATQRDENIK